MGWLAKLLGGGASSQSSHPSPLSRPTIVWREHSFPTAAVGESHYQAALEALCGGHNRYGHEMECEAELIPEPSNPYDPNAVQVMIGRRLVVVSVPSGSTPFGSTKRWPPHSDQERAHTVPRRSTAAGAPTSTTKVSSASALEFPSGDLSLSTEGVAALMAAGDESGRNRPRGRRSPLDGDSPSPTAPGGAGTSVIGTRRLRAPPRFPPVTRRGPVREGEATRSYSRRCG